MIDPHLIQPQRRNRLVDWIARVVVRNQPDKGPQPTQQDSTMTGTTAFSVQSVFDKYFMTDVERLTIYKDVQEMDEQSEECSTALDTIADNVVSSEDGVQHSIEIITEDSKADMVIQEMLARVDLYKKLYSIVRNTLKFGDNFCEVVVNGEGDVVGIKPLPPNTVYRNEDRFGNLILDPPVYNSEGQCMNPKEGAAFVQLDNQTQRVIAAFYPWQIIHFRHNWDGMSPYGRSMMKVTRVIWRKLKAEEEALIIGRLTRAYMKLVYHVDTTGLSKNDKIQALREFRDNMTQRQTVDGRRESQFSVMSDIYLSSGNIRMGTQVAQEQTKVDILDPKNEGLQNTQDMEYFHRKMLSTVRVPPAHMGFEKDVNAKATLTLQDIQYVRFLRRIQQTMGSGLEQMVDTQLTLKGMDPKQVPYVVKWPRLSATDEAVASLAEMQRAQGDQVYQQMQVIDAEFIMRTRFGFDDEDIADMKVRVEAERQKALAEQEQMANNDAQRQVQVKNAQVRAVAAKGSNNGGDTTKGDPPSGGGRSTTRPTQGAGNAQPGSRATLGVNPPTTRALRQEIVELFPAFLEAVERFKDKDGEHANGNGHDPLLEEAELAISSPLPGGHDAPEPSSVHVHLEEGMVRMDHHAPDIHVTTPDVHVDVHAPPVNVEGDTIVVEPSPVHVQAPDVQVDVHNNVPTPSVVVNAPDVKVEVIKEEPKGDVEVVQETDAEGRKVYKARRKKKSD